jgi:hypothetical protein
MTETYEDIKAKHTGAKGHATDAKPSFEVLDVGDDDEFIPPREWILGNTFCRSYVSSVVGRGASAKTTLRIAQALSIASGKPLTDEHIFVRCPVLIVCLEDSLDELRRRVRAARLHHRIGRDEVRGHLFIVAPKGLKIASHRDGSREIVAGDLERVLREKIEELGLGVVILDPFVKLHTVEENDNVAMDGVAAILARLAQEKNVAVDVVQHEKKGAADPGDMDRGRGASSVRDAYRLGYTVTGMSDKEREGFNLTEAERRSLFRLDSAKVNIAPPAAEAKWFRVIGVPLHNGTSIYPNGDDVPTVEVWTPPDLWRKVSGPITNQILDRIAIGSEAGWRYSAAAQAKTRAAWHVVKAIVPELSDTQARTVIDTWVKNGVVKTEPYRNSKEGRDEDGLFVNDAKRPS